MDFLADTNHMMQLKKQYFLSALLGLGSFFISRETYSQQDIYDSLNVNGIWRTYNIHLPAGYNPALSYPLVLGFHGGQQVATSAQGWTVFAYQSELSQKADNSAFIVVYPEGLVFNQNRSWNAGNCCPPAMNQGYDDVGFVDALLNRLFTDYPIDTTRVYATGSSNGGMLCYRLACELSNRIAAIAPNACSHMYYPCNPARAVPVISFHSKADPIVFYEGGTGGSPLLGTIFFPSQDSTLSYWSQLNGCVSRDTVIQGNGTNFDFIRLNSCDCGVEIHHYATTDGSHSWPGGNPNNNPVSTQINATDLLWSFFQQYSLSCGTNELQTSIKPPLRIFPNPADGYVQVFLPDNETGQVPFTVSDETGKHLLSGNITEKEQRISLTEYPRGIYFITLTEGTKQTTLKIIRQ
jgi:polyhydroxybutyrate depolymerase